MLNEEMRRRSISKRSIQTELFPFLSILACTIGTLILLIIAIASQTLSNKQEVTIVAKSEQGKNQNKTPRYLECRQDGVVIYPSQTFVPASQLSQPNSAFGQLLAQMKQKREQEYLIVAVRPEGFRVFETVRDRVEAEGIDLGYEPLDRGWTLKLE